MRKLLSLVAVLLLFSSIASAQSRIISGQVRDESGNPLGFVSVKIKGTKTGVAADAQGAFKIKAKAGDVLVFSSTGTNPTEVTVGTDDVINPVLKVNNQQLSEVVVTALGVKRAPKELGYATQRIGATELNQAHVTNAVTGLTGKVSGLQVQTTGNGVDPTIRINLRGNRSILGNNQALIVVDGSIVPSSFFSSINSDDIESINILKGVAASSVYGSDGSNGVLVVTTKRGSRGKPQIKYTSNVQFENVAIMPDLQTDWGSYGGEGGQYVDPVTGKTRYVPFENQSFGPHYDGSLVPLGTPKRFYRADGSFYDSSLMVRYTGLKNAKRDFWNTGLTTQNDLSVSAGDEKSSIFAGFQNVYNTGIVPKDFSRRNAARVNGFRDFDGFKVDYSIGYTQSEKDLVGGEFFQGRPVYFVVINTPAHVNLRDFSNTENGAFSTPDHYFNAYYTNPWWQINNSRNHTRTENLIGNVNLGLKVNNWIDASYRIGYSSSQVLFKTTQNGVTFSAYEQSDPFGISNTASGVKHTNPSEGDFTSFTSKMTGDLLVTMHKEIKDLTYKLILGHNIQMDYNRNLFAGATALTFNNFFNISTALGKPNVNETVFQRNIQGAFADGGIGYKNFLYFHGAYRSSWYSTLPAGNRRFNYGGGDVSFIVTDAFPDLFKNSALSFAKVRASYGVAGNISLDALSTYGAYLTNNTFNTAGGFPYGSNIAYTLSARNNNPNIKDERTKEIEFGLELGFLNNRINLTSSIYKQNTTNQTLPSQVSWATGYNVNLINNGESQNIGVEADLRVTAIQNTKANGFRWDVGVNFNYIQNKIVSLPGGADVALGNNSYAIVGQPFPSLKVYDWNRDSATGKIIVDGNGDPSRGSKLINVGSAFAPYRVGVTNSMSFKGFNLSFVADYRGGNIIFNQVGQDLDFSGISKHSTFGNRERFVMPNSVYDDGTGKMVPNTNRTISNVYNFWSGNINSVGTPYVTSAAFWKLREVALNYTVPKKYLNATRYIKNAVIGVFGRNLLTWRPKENIWTDPEFNNNAGINDAGFTNVNQTPPTRFWGFNLSLTF